MLVEDFQYIIRSLGGSCTITDKWVKYNGSSVLTYSCYIKFTDGKSLSRLTRKVERLHTKVGHKYCPIKSVEDFGYGD